MQYQLLLFVLRPGNAAVALYVCVRVCTPPSVVCNAIWSFACILNSCPLWMKWDDDTFITASTYCTQWIMCICLLECAWVTSPREILCFIINISSHHHLYYAGANENPAQSHFQSNRDNKEIDVGLFSILFMNVRMLKRNDGSMPGLFIRIYNPKQVPKMFNSKCKKCHNK